MTASASPRSAWETDSIIDEYFDIPGQENMMFEEAFDRVENALRNQGHYLKTLADVAIHQDREVMSTSQALLPNSSSGGIARKLAKRYQMWKNGKRDLYRFIEDLEAMMDDQIYHYHHLGEIRLPQARAPVVDSLSRPEGDGRLSTDSISPGLPCECPKLATRPLSNSNSSRSTPSPTFEGLIAIPTEPKPPIPERHPCRQISVKSTPDGEVILRGMPEGWVSNLLPWEHRASYEARKRASLQREQTSRSNLDLRGLVFSLPEATPSTSKESHSTASSRAPQPSQSISSLRLQAVPEEHPPSPQIHISSSRQISNTRRPPPSIIQHAPTTSSSNASNAFYTPRSASVPPNSRHPESKVPTVQRTPTGIFSGGLSVSRSPPRNTPRTPAPLEDTQLRETREKIIADRNMNLYQARELQKMLGALAADEAGTEFSDEAGWETVGRAHIRDGLRRESSSLGGKMKSLFRSKTGRKATTARRV